MGKPGIAGHTRGRKKRNLLIVLWKEKDWGFLVNRALKFVTANKLLVTANKQAVMANITKIRRVYVAFRSKNQ